MVLSLALVLSLLSGCAVDASKLTYLDETILVSGVTEGDLTVSIRELTALESVSEKAEGLRSNGDVVKFTAVGPTIDTFLAAYGKSRADYTGVRFSATDGFSVIIPKEVFERRDIVLAYMNGSKALDKYNAPLRAIVVGERAMYWARMVDRIDFLTDADATLTNKIVFLDTVLPAMVGEYSEEEGGDIVSTIDLLTKYGGGSLNAGDKIYLKAYDGLKKAEMMDNFLKGFIKYTGEKTPQFCSPELPEGMNMDGIVQLRAAGVTYFSLERASETYSVKEFDGQPGIAFSDINREIGFVSTDAFRFELLDGSVKLAPRNVMASGVFVKTDGRWSFIGPDGFEVTDFAFIEAVDPVMEQPEQEEQGG
jgi:hypothetical protein